MELVFRNYVPKQESLRSAVIQVNSLPGREAEVSLNEAKQLARLLPGDDKPVLVAPKRVNWDLKRDVEKRLKKLSKRTQNAICQLAEDLQREEDKEEEQEGREEKIL